MMILFTPTFMVPLFNFQINFLFLVINLFYYYYLIFNQVTFTQSHLVKLAFVKVYLSFMLTNLK